MRWKKTVSMIEAHCEGEIGRVVSGGVLDVPGATMLDKMDYLNGPGDKLRRFCVFEPRGHAAMSTNFLFPPSAQGADVGFVVLQGDRAHSMSGSNSVCVVTVMLETGMLDMCEPETVVVLDTPSGVVKAEAACRSGKCESVTLDMPPSFAEALDVHLEVPGMGDVCVDLAFGGMYYVLVDVAQTGLEIKPSQARSLVDAGCRIHRACTGKLVPDHPTHPSLNYVGYVMFTDETADGELLGATVLPPGRLDRSPCGTGNSARLAVRHARGLVRAGAESVARSIIGGRFTVRCRGLTALGGRAAVLPRITGRAWIHGIHHIGVDPSDPFPDGFCLADTWGDAVDLMN